MRDRVVALLAPREAETYADATAGLGGHAAAVARAVGPRGSIILNDLDSSNLARAKSNVAQAAPDTPVHTVNANFAALPHAAAFRDSSGGAGLRAHMLLADLGFASTQVDDPSRGFSFKHDGPLDMRFGSGGGVGGGGVGGGGVGGGGGGVGVSAADLVNHASEAELARIIHEFGEERFAKPIARKIVHARAANPINTTAQLAALVRSVVRGQPGAIDPATRTFQALRIAVNDEMGSLDAFLAAILDDAKRSRDGTPTRWLAPGARIVIISFHSLEDRRVKAAFAKGRKDGVLVPVSAPVSAPITSSAAVGADASTLALDEVAEPTEEEIRDNPRARSAKVRAASLALPK